MDIKAGKPNKVEKEGRATDCLEQICCQACQQERDVLLILPCSHTMCVQCISAGEAGKPSRARLSGVCAVACPSCGHHVELPCWNWSSATSCLPKHPPVSRARVSENTTISRDLHHQDSVVSPGLNGIFYFKRNIHCLDTGKMAALRYFHGSVSTNLPEDGNVDLSEEEMERSVFGLRFALDPASVPPCLRLSHSSLTITYQGEDPSSPPPHNHGGGSASSDPGFTLPEACADVIIGRGQYYWEVEVCNSSVYRIGVRSADGSGGLWLQRLGPSFSAVYDTTQEPLCSVPPQIKTIGVFLNIGGGILSFHNPLTQEHLATLPTLFHPAGVRPALCLGQGRIRLRSGLPPPSHVFLCRNSNYRGACEAGTARWAGDTRFQPVRKAIQKFEELSASNPGSGFQSSFGSSCFALVSLPNPHWMVPSK